MGKALTTEDCLRQAGEYLQLAEASSDPDLRQQYLKIAGELTLLAAALDARPGTQASRQSSEGTTAPENKKPGEKRR